MALLVVSADLIAARRGAGDDIRQNNRAFVRVKSAQLSPAWTTREHTGVVSWDKTITKCSLFVYTQALADDASPMIKTLKHRGLATLWETGKSRIDKRLHRRILLRLAVINEAVNVEEINLPGYNFHGLQGFTSKRYSVHVNGPWCLTFAFEDGNADLVDFEQYH